MELRQGLRGDPVRRRDAVHKYGPQAIPVGSVADVWAVPFPWTEYTTRYPPRKYPQFYARCLPADHTNANKTGPTPGACGTRSKFKPYTVQLAAAGEIKLFQIAAYDVDGNVKAVPFHVSLYYQQVSYTHDADDPAVSAPRITKVATAAVHAGRRHHHGDRAAQEPRLHRRGDDPAEHRQERSPPSTGTGRWPPSGRPS